MVQTRAQEKDATSHSALDSPTTSPGNTHTRKRSQGTIQDALESPPPPNKKAKTERTSTTASTKGNKTKQQQRAKDENDGQSAADQKQNNNNNNNNNKGNTPKIQSLIDKHGSLPLSHTALESPSSPAPETLLALLLNAMLSSARISHELAARTAEEVIKAGYHRLETLRASTWEERTGVLTEGGYARYREKTATALGDLAELLESEYDGDLNNLRKSAHDSPTKIRAALKEIKQLGDVGIDIFFDTAQGVWPCLAPFIDPRSKKTADAIGIGSDEGVLWKEVGEDPVQMCKLASALTSIRLDKKEAELQS
ncbi:hypothetical protein VM1G_02177 [Cytospora mali]|uniref:Uncharacterized protein n=1 Tax=Cytospora mali TaxID=578113 RepID=A0A194VQI1_CYTMA|nr:hypothetical protein VM1G_02177 [Valsa mali]